MLIPSYSTAELLFKTFMAFKPLVHLVATYLQRCVFLCTRFTKPAFWLPVSSSHLISVPPNWQRHATKKVRSFIPCHFIIFGEWSDPPRNLRDPDFRNLGSRPRTNRPRNLQHAGIKEFKMAANTRDNANFIFSSTERENKQRLHILQLVIVDTTAAPALKKSSQIQPNRFSNSW